MRNPVNAKKHYRYYVIYKIPSLRVLDFQRIRQKVCYWTFFFYLRNEATVNTEADFPVNKIFYVVIIYAVSVHKRVTW